MFVIVRAGIIDVKKSHIYEIIIFHILSLEILASDELAVKELRELVLTSGHEHLGVIDFILKKRFVLQAITRRETNPERKFHGFPRATYPAPNPVPNVSKDGARIRKHVIGSEER